MADSALYRRIIARDFEKLPLPLQRFHDSPTGGRGSGAATVRRGKGLLRRIIAALMGLPKAGEKVRVDLEVEVIGEREIWRRTFDGRPFTTMQWDADGLLAERAGPVTLRFRLHADQHGMRFEHRGTSIAGVPIPRTLAPSVTADALARGEGWDLRVTITAPLVGMVTTYTGYIIPTQ
jgi:Domain of unknown function (DUF4166)